MLVMKTKLWKNFIATLVIFVLLYYFGPTFLYLLKDLIYPTVGQSYESSAIGNLRTVVGAQSAYKKRSREVLPIHGMNYGNPSEFMKGMFSIILI